MTPFSRLLPPYLLSFFLAFCAFTLVCATAAMAQEEDEGQDRIAVAIGTIKHLPNLQTRHVIGTTRARQTASLRPDSAGRIEEIFVSSGQKVEAGQQILKLESSAEELAVASAKVNYRSAQRVVKRYKYLVKKGVITSVTEEDAQGDLESAQIALDEAELALSERYVLAPFSGDLGLINLNVGSHVSNSTSLVQLNDSSSLLLDFSLPESAVGSIALGHQIPVTPMAGGKAVDAKVIAIERDINPAARTFNLRAEITDPTTTMLPGMSFKVSVETDNGRHPVVPEAAILWGSRGAYLWRLEEGKAVRTQLVVVRRQEGQVWIDADLPEGTPFVSEGVHKVREGEMITAPNRQSLSLVQTH
ncbi:efflux RND transporter periplasmic adaptor subunit [Rhodovibrionaceae bacterium A322]